VLPNSRVAVRVSLYLPAEEEENPTEEQRLPPRFQQVLSGPIISLILIRCGFRYSKSRDHGDFHVDSAALLSKNKKKVSIVPPSHPMPSTSTQEFKEAPSQVDKLSLPQINLPDGDDVAKMSREDSVIELQNLELVYDMQSVSSNDSDDNGVTVIDTTQPSKLMRTREPANRSSATDDLETCLSVVIERSDNSESSDGQKNQDCSEKQTHSGIVLSPLQLGQ
jgi:hypothetical protein